MQRSDNVKVKEIFDFLNRLYPLETACDFDNPGLLIGDGEANVSKALIALDCTLETVKKAIKENANLIITHHPVIFGGLKKINAGSISFELIKNGISVISMHTNLDIGEGGVNDCLCKVLKLEKIIPYTAKDGYLLKCGTVSPISADFFAKQIKDVLGGCIKYVDGGRKIEKVLVCSGSGGDFISDAINGGFDALVTADIKHHCFLEAKDFNLSLFDAGHFNTEDIVIEPLKETLKKEFPEIDFITYHSTSILYC